MLRQCSKVLAGGGSRTCSMGSSMGSGKFMGQCSSDLTTIAAAGKHWCRRLLLGVVGVELMAGTVAGFAQQQRV